MQQAIGLSGALLGVIAGSVVGFGLGKRYRVECRRGRFWIASVASVLIGMLVMFAGFMTSVVFVSGAGVGLMTGGLNGLRWGMGRLSDVPRKKPAPVTRCEAEADAGSQAEPSPDHRPDEQRPHAVT